jgi:hypothetical protein
MNVDSIYSAPRMLDGILGAGIDACTAGNAFIDIDTDRFSILDLHYFHGTGLLAFTGTDALVVTDLHRYLRILEDLLHLKSPTGIAIPWLIVYWEPDIESMVRDPFHLSTTHNYFIFESH